MSSKCTKLLLSAVMALTVVFVSGCAEEDSRDASRWPDTQTEGHSNLETGVPEPIEYVEDMQFYSVVTGFNSMTKTFLEAGRIQSINVVEGQAAQAGDRLATMYSPTLPEEFSEAEVTLKKAQAETLLRTGDYDRSVQLFEKRLISQEEFDQIKRNFDVAALEVEEAKARVAKFGNALSSLEIVAMEDGIVSQIFKREGDFLNEGEPLLRFESTAKQKAIFEVPERVSIELQPGQQQLLFFPALNKTALARVTEKSSPNTGGFALHRVTLEVEEADRNLIGLRTVLLLQQGGSLAYKVDYRAIRYSKNNDPYVIRLEDKLVHVAVDVIDIDRESVIVDGHLADSDSILIGSDISVPLNLYTF